LTRPQVGEFGWPSGKFKEMPAITPEMIILDVVSMYPKTEGMFKRYDEKAGVCLCCQALFEPLEDVAEKFGLDLEQMLSDLEKAANKGEGATDSGRTSRESFQINR
jgi:hypothetical protein